MSLTKSDCKKIDQALATKRHPAYQEGYDAARREVEMLAASGMTTAQIIAAMSQPAREGMGQ